MRTRMIVVLSMLVLLPVMALGWLGTRLVLKESEMAKHQLRELQDAQLTAWDEQLHELMQDRERVFLDMAATTKLDPDSLRATAAAEDSVIQAFLLTASGELSYPRHETGTPEECAFLERTAQVWQSRELVIEPADVQQQEVAQAEPSYGYASNKGVLRQYQVRKFDSRTEQSLDESQQQLSPQQLAQAPQWDLQRQNGVIDNTGQSNWSGRALDAGGDTASGWYTWYQGAGMQVLFWRRLADGRLLGFELDGERLLADVGKVLKPDQMHSSLQEQPRVALIDGRGAILQEWGRTPQSLDELSLWAVRVLQPPLQSWRLAVYLPPNAGNSLQLGILLNVAALVLVFALVVVGLGSWLYRETGREMKQAAQRVSFVNNVSHELKTPLTNIRMYAELMENTVDEDDDRSRKYLQTVVRESQRLSRLIGNVLSFAREQRGERQLQAQVVVPDEILQAVLEQFRPSMATAGIEVRVLGEAKKAMRLDRDILEQVVVNLLSNVEKYGAAGKRLELRSSQQGGVLTVSVRDWGAGVPAREKERIFEPFYRMSNKTNDGVAGTGIGLSIARGLARRHGGDLSVESKSPGSEFSLTMKELAG